MNRLRAASIPINTCTSFGLLGSRRRFTASICRIDFYPPASDQVPQKFASPHSKGAFFCVKAQLMFPQYLKHPLKILYMPRFLLALYHHVINIHFSRMPNFVPEQPHHHSLICHPGILQPKGHHGVMIISVGRYECRLLLVLSS